MGELRSRGIGLVAAALAQSTDHILDFFSMLRLELGFYVGCLNLRDRLARKREPLCFPVPLASGNAMLSGRGLYDPCLSLNVEQRVVGNDVNADDKLLVMMTGANQGGKSTFLRSIGLAQLMMQCGMFVPAQSFRANVCDGVFTHFKREEDAGMKSGKLDEELSRMSSIVDNLSPEQHRSIERVVRVNQRERRFGDRQANCPGSVGKRHQSILRDPSVRFGARAFTVRRWTRPCSFVPKGWLMGGERFDWSKPNRCPPAMGRLVSADFRHGSRSTP